MRKVLVCCREKFKKKIAYFHVLGLFKAKKYDLSENKIFRLSRAGAYSLPFKS
jgi:hypothetical protein